MMKFLRLALVLLSALVATPSLAQWQVPSHTVPVGRGAGITGFANTGTGSAGQVLTSNGASADPTFQPASGGGGTVTSVGLSAPSEFSVSGSPVTTSGTLTFGWISPVTVPHGGTGDTFFTSGLPLFGAGTSPITTGTLSGNTTKLATSTGTLTSGDCVKLDASSNYIDAGGNCGLPALTGDLDLYVRTAPATVTISIASPAVVSWTGHGLSINSPVVFNTTSALPTGVTAGTIYYVISAGFGVNAFEFSTSLGGSAVNTTGSQSGTQTAQTGDDAHDCSAATVTKACLTIQHTVTLAQGYDLNGFEINANLAHGLYLEDVSVVGMRSWVEPEGQSTSFSIIGDHASPDAVIIQGALSSISVGSAFVVIDGITVQGGIYGIDVSNYGAIQIHAVNFGTISGIQVLAADHGSAAFLSDYSITGGSFYHWLATSSGTIAASSLTVTLTGTPNFTLGFASASTNGNVSAVGLTFTGSATGPRYFANLNGAILTNNAGITYLPGDAPGTLESGGQYDDTYLVDLATGVTGDLPVTNLDGGSGATSSTFWRGDGTWAPASGGGGGTVTNTGTLTANRLILGNAGVDVTALGSLGTTTTVLHGNAAGAPTFGAVANADLTNSATTVNGQTCTLGSTCTVTAAATAITVGSTTVGSGTTTRILFDNAGVLGEYTLTGSAGSVVMSSSPTIASPTFSGTVAGANTIPLGVIAQSGANTMLGNWTGSTANVAANAMPSCADTGTNHLNYVSGTGITCGTSGGGGSGTVTSIATTAPLAGGTITTTGTLSITGAAGQVLAGASPAFTATPTLGVAGATLGTLTLAGSTSGSTVVQPNVAASGTLTLPAATDTLVGKATTDILTNKTISGASNTITNVSLATGVTGNLPVTNLNSGTSASSSTFWRGDGSWATPAGSGTVTNTGTLTANRIIIGNGSSDVTTAAGLITDGASKITLGVAGSSVGGVVFNNATSGTITIAPVTGALSSGTLSLPNATDTLMGKATTDTMTNKTYDTAGSGNSFSINGVAATANTGTGAVVRATSPTLVTPALGTPTALVLTSATGLPVASVVGDTSTALGVGSIELGNASDTTIARSAAGIISIEGLPLYSGIPQNSKSAAYTLVLADAQEQIYHPTGDNNARTWTIPANGSVAYPIGTVLTFINDINTITISITTDTMVLCGTGSTGSRTLAVNGMATAVKVTSTRWYICGQGLT